MAPSLAAISQNDRMMGASPLASDPPRRVEADAGVRAGVWSAREGGRRLESAGDEAHEPLHALVRGVGHAPAVY